MVVLPKRLSQTHRREDFCVVRASNSVLGVLSIVEGLCSALRVPREFSSVTRGSKSKFCAEIAALILADIAAGISLCCAADRHGITRQTVNEWRRRGKRTGEADKAYRQFREDYQKALGQGMYKYELCTAAAGATDAKIALTILGKRWPQVWGDKLEEAKRLNREMDEKIETLRAILGKLPDSPQERS